MLQAVKERMAWQNYMMWELLMYITWSGRNKPSSEGGGTNSESSSVV